MKNYLICAGGSGVRALESMLHLCAAGLGQGKVDEVKILIIDPDGANGNYDRASQAFTDYRSCCNAYGGKLGGEHFFRTRWIFT